MSHWHSSQGDNTCLTSSTGGPLSRLPRCDVAIFRRDDGHITTKPWVRIETAAVAAEIDRKSESANFWLEELSITDLELLEETNDTANLSNVQVSGESPEAEWKTRQSKIPDSGVGKSWMPHRHNSMKPVITRKALRKYAATLSRAQPGTACDLNYGNSNDSSPWYSRTSFDSVPSSLTCPSVDEYYLEQKGGKMSQKRVDQHENLPGSKLKHLTGLLRKANAASIVLCTKRPTIAEVEMHYCSVTSLKKCLDTGRVTDPVAR